MKQSVTISTIFFVTAVTLSKAATTLPCSVILANMETIGTFAASTGAVIRNYCEQLRLFFIWTLPAEFWYIFFQLSYTAAGSCPMVQAYSIIFSTAVLGEPFTPDCDDVDGNLGNIQTAMTDLTASYVDFSECFTSINVIICIIYFSILYCN